MLRIIQHRPRPPPFNNLSFAYDDNVVADVIGRRELMRDVDDQKAELVFQPAEEVDDRHAKRCVDQGSTVQGHVR